MRLDLELRSAQEMARTGRILDRLPRLRQANDDGRLSASQVRELTRVAQPWNEEAWIEKPTGGTVRDLRITIRKYRIAEATRNGFRSAAREQTGVPVAIEMPASVRAKWEVGVEPFRKLEGRDDLPVGAAAEAFAAEYLSGAPPLPPWSFDAAGGADDKESKPEGAPLDVDVDPPAPARRKPRRFEIDNAPPGVAAPCAPGPLPP